MDNTNPAFTADELESALLDALAIAEEHGTSIETKLAAFGLNHEDVREMLTERWQAHAPQFEPEKPHLLFVQGYTEGMMTALRLMRGRG